MNDFSDPMSVEEMSRVLKHLPEPDSLEVILSNFHLFSVEEQAKTLFPNLKLSPLGYQSLSGRIESPKKSIILELYETSGMDLSKEDSRFISFKMAEWYHKNHGAGINLDSYRLIVNCYDEVPVYIKNMIEELRNTNVKYEVIQSSTR